MLSTSMAGIGLNEEKGVAIGSASQYMMGKKQYQALKARNSKAQGEGCEAAETLGVRRRNEEPCKGDTDRCVALTGLIWGYSNTQGLRPGLC
jgi:hypothetical protein